MMSGTLDSAAAEERKRKRLEAWRLRQQQQQQELQQTQQLQQIQTVDPPKPKISLSFVPKGMAKKKTVLNKASIPSNANTFTSLEFGDDAEDDSLNTQHGFDRNNRKKRKLDFFFHDNELSNSSAAESPTAATMTTNDTAFSATITASSQRRRRWDNPSQTSTTSTISTTVLPSESMSSSAVSIDGPSSGGAVDALDQFMENLESKFVSTHAKIGGFSRAGVITAEELELLNSNDKKSSQISHLYSDLVQEKVASDEIEEKARRELIEALKQQGPMTQTDDDDVKMSMNDTTKSSVNDNSDSHVAQLAAEVKSEKSRREERLRELEVEAEEARKLNERIEPEFGRYLFDDAESGVMDESERNLDAAKTAPDALTVLAELNKKKEIQAVDHASIDYLPFTANLYRVPRALAHLKHEDVIDRRAKLKVRVRGHGAPAPIQTFEQSGLSELILSVLRNQNIEEPFPVQAQCIPCIMAGRDVIGIAKTGSGKTLAYLLPLLRHILVQSPLASNESGPIGLILAPARELAFQINSVCKMFTKLLGLKSISVYGGAGVAEQIADLKRGAHIVTATPGRLIDILTMQSGKILSLKRVTYVVMDEADRMFDMGFAPQISAILAAVRPDRQTVLFSATFPKAIENLARTTLKYPLEVVVGGRSVASENVTQHAELIEEEDKFFRLLQILGDHIDGSKKAIIFVDTQVRADSLFEQLLRSGYSTLSLHGGKDQEDRDSTISDFKRKEGPNLLVATGVAGRGLDVARVCCVVNFSAPNHLEAFVHQTGRTGRAGNTGVAYTFVNSTDEAKYAPIVVRALSEAGQSENINVNLKSLSDDFKAMVEKGEAKYAGSGFKGKGYSYDSSELSEAQRVARLEKRQALIDAGLLDPEDDDSFATDQSDSKHKNDTVDETGAKKIMSTKEAISQMKIPENLTPELLALPGMKEALLRTAGIISGDDERLAESDNQYVGKAVQTSDNHWVQEFEINDYPREARWRVTQKETTSRLQEEFRTAVTLKGSFFPVGKEPKEGERKLYLHLEATSGTILKNGVMEISRMLNEETLRVTSKMSNPGSHKYNVLG